MLLVPPTNPMPVTGKGITSSVAMELADLGAMRWDSDRGAIAAMFGDNFSYSWGQDWQSPSIVMYDNDFKPLGIPTKNGIEVAPRRQLWDYPHNNAEYTTILPCDFIRVEGVWYVCAMVTRGLGNELRTVFWQSDDLVDWELTNPYVRLDHKPGSHIGLTMLTFDVVGDWVYIFGTGGLARNQPIWLWRSPVDKFPYGEWELRNNGAPVLGGRYGELSFRFLQGNSVLSFFDAGRYCCSALTVIGPEDNWAEANRVDYAWGHSTPQLYGGYIVPGSELNSPGGLNLWVSQWNTMHNNPYHVLNFNTTLQARGPIVETPTEPTEPESEDDLEMTPQELYELLLKELSASGSKPIVTPEGAKLTLREAVEQVFWKQRGWHDLKGRPRHPSEKDDMLGQILSLRAELLFTQAVVVAIADKFGLDAQALYDQVKESLG